ncbi:hypothetical protein BH10ACT3_BH10ACT3_11880 [soil metagenome]
MTAPAEVTDPRLAPPRWDPAMRAKRSTVIMLVVLNVGLSVWYLSWLLQPQRVGNPWLYGAIVAAEAFNLIQGISFWWTALGDRNGVAARPSHHLPRSRVDVLIPVCGEPLEVVEPTVIAAGRLSGGHDVQVLLLDDGDDPEMECMAARHGARYVRRSEHTGAKAGNINHALGITDAEFVVVFDCDHVPVPEFLDATLGHFSDDGVAFVQTPQYYANEVDGGIPAASSAQQQLFFGIICRGKAGRNSVFCCGTNVVFRRSALDDIGGFPEDSVTEDFALSIRLHSRGWSSRYVAEVLASGLGPEDMASYVSQQRRWARGCLDAIPVALRTRLPMGQRLQYLASSMYFLSGWTVAIYMAMPVIRLFGGGQPVATASADAFLTHFGPYFLCSLATVAIASEGSLTFAGFSLSAANFGVHIRASLLTLARRRGRFVVTPKRGASGRQFRPIGATLVAGAILMLAIVWGLVGDQSPGTLNNIAFAAIHVAILTAGVLPALSTNRSLASVPQEEHVIDLRQTDAEAAA